MKNSQNLLLVCAAVFTIAQRAYALPFLGDDVRQTVLNTSGIGQWIPLNESDLVHRQYSDFYLKADWAKMQTIQGMMTRGYELPELVDAGIVKWKHVRKYRILSHLMIEMFLQGRTSTFYNVATSRWTTCAMFNTKVKAMLRKKRRDRAGKRRGRKMTKRQKEKMRKAQVVFCASNKSIGLPVPCRGAQEGVDFQNSTAFNDGPLHEDPAPENQGPFLCESSEISYSYSSLLRQKSKTVSGVVKQAGDEFGEENWVVSTYEGICPTDPLDMLYPCNAACW